MLISEWDEREIEKKNYQTTLVKQAIIPAKHIAYGAHKPQTDVSL